MNWKTAISILMTIILLVSLAQASEKKEEKKLNSMSCKADALYDFQHPNYWLFYVKKDGKCCSYTLAENMIEKACT